MNIYEAIKSGRRFRLKGSPCAERNVWIERPEGGGYHTLNFEWWSSLASDDWEVEPDPPISITKDGFLRIVARALKAKEVKWMGVHGMRDITERDILGADGMIQFILAEMFPENKEPTP